MTTGDRTISVEDLLHHQAWLQRIARHLVREGAEDTVQEVWAAAAERPPAARGNLRGWLTTTLLNRAHNRRRGDDRRLRREVAVTAWSSPPATPEEVAARMELQRKLAAAVAALPEPYKHVIYLRYVEDREPTEIARLLATPPGTVRWRLKEGLAKLREQLDREHDGRRAVWLGIIGPGLARPPVLRWRWPVAAATLGVCAAVSVFVWQRDSRAPAIAMEGPPPAGGIRRGGPPRTPIFATQAAATIDDDRCPTVAPMEERLAALKAASDPWRNLRELYREGAPNPKLETSARPLIEAAFAQAPEGCAHSLSCRGMICEVTFMTPDGMGPRSCSPKTDARFREHLSSGTNNLVDSGTPFHDPTNGKSYLRQTQLWRFEREDAAAVPLAERSPLPALQLPAPPREPSNLSGGCRARWRELTTEYHRILRDLAEITPQLVFAASAPSPELSARVTRWSARVLKRPADRLPFALECRGNVCALTPGATGDPLAIKWMCREKMGPPGPALCFPDRDGQGWYGALEEASRGLARLRAPVQGPGAIQRPAYLVLSPRDDRPAPWAAALAFMDSFDWRSALKACADRFPETGTLKTMTEFPEVTGTESTPSHPTFHKGGDLAGSKLGACVSAAFEAAAAAFAVPPIANGLVLYGDIKFPLDVSAFEQKLERMRQRVRDEATRPAL